MLRIVGRCLASIAAGCLFGVAMIAALAGVLTLYDVMAVFAGVPGAIA